MNSKKKIVIAGILFFVMIFFFVSSAPSNFSSGTTITIAKGESIRGAALELEQKNIIRFSSVFNIFITFYGSKVVEGDYVFEKPINLFKILYRITNGEYNIETRSITFYEGMTVREMATKLKTVFPEFDSEEFMALAKKEEGYLFPDTYKFRINVDPETVILETKNNFEKKIKENEELIKNSKYSLSQIVIMASIVEKESTRDGRQEVANILWERFEEDFPLQVDAPFVYAIGKGTADLTKADLETDNPYNTYKNIGLTPTPIGNPGVESILAAANPRPTRNFYFLTGRDGEMRYAETFDGHKRNRFLYLD